MLQTQAKGTEFCRYLLKLREKVNITLNNWSFWLLISQEEAQGAGREMSVWADLSFPLNLRENDEEVQVTLASTL